MSSFGLPRRIPALSLSAATCPVAPYPRLGRVSHRNPVAHDALQRQRQRGNDRAYHGGAWPGMQIDNCEIWVDQPEMPGLDGSCLPFVEVFKAAGIVEQDAIRRAKNHPQALYATAMRTVGSKPGPVAPAR